MQILSTVAAVRVAVQAWGSAGEDIVLVATMGNLHAGHLRLVQEARQRSRRVVVSIFVNPLQFGPRDDFSSYPRTPAQDEALLAGWGVDAIFAPSAAEMYPAGVAQSTRVEVPDLSDVLCGRHRPGHFAGVATVVSKLFNIVQPRVAIFGEKDFQQLVVIRKMVTDLDIPVEIVGVATVREADGLALSSRNSYLTPDERAIAPRLWESLRTAAARLEAGDVRFGDIEAEGMHELRSAGLRPDYFAVRNAATLALPNAGDSALVVLAAATLGRARLIDNCRATVYRPGQAA
jgi:pantoate--beta-alanine ligase